MHPVVSALQVVGGRRQAGRDRCGGEGRLRGEYLCRSLSPALSPLRS